MAINYSGTITGTMTIKGKDRDNKPKTCKMEFRNSNCLACLIEVTKAPKKEGEKQKYYHTLIWFAADAEHLKRMSKVEGGLKTYFYGNIKVRLNIYYKENETLSRYFAKSGIKTEIYFEEPKPKK